VDRAEAVVPEGIRALADRSGIVVGFAFDHRDSLDVVLEEAGIALDATGIRRLKAAVVREIAPLASAVMLDHDYGAEALATGAIPDGVGLVMPLEAQGYAQLGDERRTTLLEGFGPADAGRLGAAACKLLVPLRPDRAAFAADQLGVAGDAVAAAHRAGLPLVLEPQVYRLSSETADVFARRRPGLTLEAVAAVASVGPDLLKLPAPVGESGPAGSVPARAGTPASAAWRAMAEATGGIPWVLYGAGAGADAFTAQLEDAGAAGASGFLVGRTIWRDVLAADPAVAAERSRRVAAPRFTSLAATARATCRPLGRPAAEAS
jgi:tagatose 1,6-diphosphate aldolase